MVWSIKSTLWSLCTMEMKLWLCIIQFLYWCFGASLITSHGLIHSKQCVLQLFCNLFNSFLFCSLLPHNTFASRNKNVRLMDVSIRNVTRKSYRILMLLRRIFEHFSFALPAGLDLKCYVVRWNFFFYFE